MNITSSTTKTHVLTALDRLDRCQNDTAQARADAVAAKTQLDGYEGDVRAIKFDRPDRDVSVNGDHLRAKTDGCAGPSSHGLEVSNSVKEGGLALAAHIDDALKSLTPSQSSARSNLETAARDARSLNENTMGYLTVSLKRAHRESQEELSPYLTEVQEDAPGRDVGRFADDIGALFSDAIADYREGDLGGKFVSEDLTRIRANLVAARDKLK